MEKIEYSGNVKSICVLNVPVFPFLSLPFLSKCHPPDLIESPIQKIVKDKRLEPFLIGSSTECDVYDPKILVYGNMTVAFQSKDFNILMNELKLKFPEYYENEISTIRALT